MFNIRKKLEKVLPIVGKNQISLPNVNYQYFFMDRPLVVGSRVTFKCAPGKPDVSCIHSVKLLLTNIIPQWAPPNTMNNTNMAEMLQNHLHTDRKFSLELKDGALVYTLDGDTTVFEKCMCIDIRQPLFIAVMAHCVSVTLDTNIKDVRWLSTTFKEMEGGNYVVTDDDPSGMPDPEYSYYISNRGEYGGGKIYHGLSGKIHSQFQLQAVDPNTETKITRLSMSLFPFRNVACELLAAQACFLPTAFTYARDGGMHVTCVIDIKRDVKRGWVQLYITNAQPHLAIRGPFDRDSSLIVDLALVTVTDNSVVTLSLDDVGLVVAVGQERYSVSNVPYVNLERPLYAGFRAGGAAIQIRGFFDHTDEVYHLGVDNPTRELACHSGLNEVQTKLSRTACSYAQGTQPTIEFSIKPVSASPRLILKPVHTFGWLGSRACKPPSLRVGGPPPPPIVDNPGCPVVRRIYRPEDAAPPQSIGDNPEGKPKD